MALNRRTLRGMVGVIWILAIVVGLSTGALLAQAMPECTIWVQPGESIQAAIDAAPEGAVICLPAGIWEENIVIEKSITLRGMGAEQTIIDGIEDGYPVVWIMGPEEEVQAISVQIEGLTITGADGRCADEEERICAHGVLIQGSAQVAITRSTISGNGVAGIMLLGSAQAEITNATISENGKGGIVLLDSAQTEITGSTISGNGVAGIMLADSAQAVITSSTISENGKGGIVLVGSAQAVITDSSIVGHRLVGVELRDSAQAVVTDSTISENREWGIQLAGSAWAEITDSTISENGKSGIMLRDSAQAEIIDSTISESGWGVSGLRTQPGQRSPTPPSQRTGRMASCFWTQPRQ